MNTPSLALRRVATAAGLCLAPLTALADDAPAADQPPAEAAVAVERVVVTSQKRPQFAEKVPMSLSALTREALERQSAVDIQDIARITPGLNARAADTFGRPNLSMRGIKSDSGAATTAVYIDDAAIAARDFSATSGGTLVPRLFDLDRVEVLRGPQGTLFGSGAMGGAVRFITPTPSLQRSTGLARLGLGLVQHGAPSHEAGVAAGGPLVADTLAYRASLWHKGGGGFIDHVDRASGATTLRDTNNDGATVLRGALLWRASETVTLAPSLTYQRDRMGDRATWYEALGAYRTYNKIAQPIDDRYLLASLSVDVELQAASFKSVTSYFNRKQRRIDDYSHALVPGYFAIVGAPVREDLPGEPDFVARSLADTGQRAWSQEFRLASPEGENSRVSWVAGVYAAVTRQPLAQSIEMDTQAFYRGLAAGGYDIPPLRPELGVYFVEQDQLQDKVVAVFGQASLKLGSATTLTLGLRAERTSYRFTQVNDGMEVPEARSASGDQRSVNLLPKLAISQDLQGGGLLYASASKGVRVGGANASFAGVAPCAPDLQDLGVSDVPRTYTPDSVWSYEAGWKTRLLDNRLELATSVYRIHWRDIQQNVLLLNCQFNYVANLGQALSQGLDLQAQWRATRALTLSGSVATTRARLRSSVWASDAARAAGRPPVVVGGQPLPEPGTALNLGAEYTWTPVAGWRAHVRGDLQWQSSYQATGPQGSYTYDEARLRAPATRYLSLHAGVVAGATTWSLALDNVTGTTTALTRYRYHPQDPQMQAITYRPRSLRLTVDRRF